jgi:cytochrome c oxidase cbb3-type subunit 4
MLLVLFMIFVGVGFWVIRPGSREIYRDTAAIPFRHDDAPMGPEEDHR